LLGVRLYLAEPGVGSFIGEALGGILGSYRIQWIGTPAAAGQRPAMPANWDLYSPEDRERLAKARAARQRPVDGFEETSHFAAYRRMVHMLAENGASICFLRMPVTAEYLDVTKTDLQYAKAFKEFRGSPRPTVAMSTLSIFRSNTERSIL
jgi:hypothetical protein